MLIFKKKTKITSKYTLLIVYTVKILLLHNFSPPEITLRIKMFYLNSITTTPIFKKNPNNQQKSKTKYP